MRFRLPSWLPKPGLADPADLAMALGRVWDERRGALSILVSNPTVEAVTSRFGARPLPQQVIPARKFVCSVTLFRQVVRQMELTVLSERRISAGRYLFDLQQRPAPEAEPLVFSHCIVRGNRCVLDGDSYNILRGNWAFYVPALQLKILHARQGLRWCLHESRPGAGVLATAPGDQRLGPYSVEDWRRALATPVLRRVAENHVSARRLAKAGVGPAVGRRALISALSYEAEGGSSLSGGFQVANLTAYLPRRQTQLADLARAQVSLDHIGSALRQQIRGYVSDLDSVIGVYPFDAEDEVRAREGELMKVAAGA